MNTPRIRSRVILLSLLGLAAVFMAGCADIPKMEEVRPAALRERLQPPLTDEQLSQLSGELRLAPALILGASRNPMLQAERKRWLASIETLPQATSLPDPMAQAGFQMQSVETRVGPQEFNAGLTQSLPWWQKLWARGKSAEIQAAIAQLKYETALRDLVIQIKDSYYELYYLDRAIAITQKIESLLRDEAILGYQELLVGRTQLNESFRAESWAAQLGYDRILLDEQRRAQAERFRALLNLPPDTPIGEVTTCPLYDPVDDITPLYQRAEDYAEILKIRGLEIVKSKYDVFLAQLSRVPDIALGLNFINTGAARMAGVGDSGKDPFIGLFSMNLPIWEQRNRALIHEKEAVAEAMEQQAMNEVNDVRRGVARAYFAANLTGRLVHLYADTLLPQAESVMQQAELFFRNDQASFSSMIECTLAYHNFQLAYHRALADYGQSIGRLEQVIGGVAFASVANATEQE